MTGGTAPRVAVIGAGLAGVSAARWLVQAGANVAVLEKSAGVGGRMATRRRDGWNADHGVPAFAAHTAAFAAEVARWQATGWVAAHGTGWIGVPTMHAPVRGLAAGLALTTAITVRALQRSPAGWHLHAEAQAGPQVYGPFDALVLAIPLPQAQALLRTVPGTDRLLALLQPGNAAIDPCWTLLVRHASPWMPPVPLAVVPPLAKVVPQAGRAGRADDAWVLHAQADWSRTHLEADPAWITASLLTAFASMGAPVPVATTVHRWRYAQGGLTVSPTDLWWPDLRLALCGDGLIPLAIPASSTSASAPAVSAGLAGVEAAWHSARAVLPALCAALALPVAID